MREFLLNSCSTAIWIITFLELVLIVAFFIRYSKTKNTMILCMGLITIGLFIDALFISLGTVLPESTLATISPIRFISHGILIPLLFPIGAYGMDAKKGFKKAMWILAIVLMIAGAAEGFATDLNVQSFAGVVRFVSADTTPGWATAIAMGLSFGTVIPLMIFGIIAWKRKKTPCLFLAGFLMFAFSAIGPATGNSDLIFYISMFGELLMVFFFYLFSRQTIEVNK